MFKLAPGRHRPYIALVTALLAFAVYGWQVISAWQAVLNPPNQDRLQRDAGAGRPSQIVELSGTGVAAGATGTLRFNSGDTVGQLRVQDLPILPPSKVYKLWCIDPLGTADGSGTFKVPIDSVGPTAILIQTPRLLVAYSRFQITIEPVDSSDVLSGTVAMTN